MIKAAFRTLCCSTLFLGTVLLAPAQSTPSDAVQEAVMRQANHIALRETLVEADAAEKRGDLRRAATLYDEAWNLAVSVGPGAEKESALTVAGLKRVRLELARIAQRRGDYREAKVHLDDIRRVAPTDQEVVRLADENEALLQANVARRPRPEIEERIPIVLSNRTEVAITIQDARLLYELGRLDEAEAKLKEALAQEPGNTDAGYYYRLILEERRRRSVERRAVDSRRKLVAVEDAWNDPVSREGLPVPNPSAHTNLIYTGPGRQAILSKLDRIRLDNVSYPSLPLSEVLRTLSEEVRKRDPEQKGINFLINPNQENTPPTTQVTVVPGAGGPGGAGGATFPGAAVPPTPGFAQQGIPGAPGQQQFDPITGLPVQAPVIEEEPIDINSIQIRIEPPLTDVRLADVLEAIVTVAERPIRYSLTDYAVVFSLKGPESPRLYMRTFKVDPNTFIQGL
ncbi:MAG TPA: hypothetical protein PLH97_15340, partial [Verrucomicrobiota bacterium]|nr:hypothetical protein [Verrucomicrobiota bacterium]